MYSYYTILYYSIHYILVTSCRYTRVLPTPTTISGGLFAGTCLTKYIINIYIKIRRTFNSSRKSRISISLVMEYLFSDYYVYDKRVY